MSSKNQSFQETCTLFNSESNKLQDNIKNALEKSENLSIREIVDIYYQIMNVNSIAKFLKQYLSDKNSELIEEHKTLLSNISKTENFISQKFDATLHPLIMSQLTNSIAVSMDNLKSAKKGLDGKKSKSVIEQDAKSYDKLREMMSTKEFVDQYDKGLKHD